MSRSMYEVNEELKKKHNTKCNTFARFPIGARVMVITQCQDFNFFEGDEKGTVIRNRGIDITYGVKNPSCGIIIKFDEPRHFEGGHVQKEFGFDPEDLILIETHEEGRPCNACKHGYEAKIHYECGKGKVEGCCKGRTDLFGNCGDYERRAYCKSTLEDLIVGRCDSDLYYRLGHVKRIVRYKWDSGGEDYFAVVQLHEIGSRNRVIDEYEAAGGKMKEYVKKSYRTVE